MDTVETGDRGVPHASAPRPDRALRIEQHGIDRIPEAERWARPRDIAGMWAGASLNVEYFVYGAILLGFGFSFWQALSIILVGNLSWFLVGLCSLQGPQSGTTVFGINRASYGPQGSKLLALFNWITMLGFEVEGLILIVGAGLVLAEKAGFRPGSPAKAAFILLAVAIQIVLPLLGHAAMVKVLRLLIVPFAIIFGILLVYGLLHGNTAVRAGSWDGWRLYTLGLAFTITLSGLGWTECGNDYSRYLRPDASKARTIGWLFVATALPETLMMAIGALCFTFVGSSGTWNGANPFEGFQGQHAIPSVVVVAFLVLAVVQLFGINSLDLYSSGVTLQALGLRLERYQAVVLDSVICLGVTVYAVFDSTFSTYMKDFVDVVIVWIAPWCSIFLVDWAMRRFRYVPGELQKTDRTSLYWASGGVNWAAIIAQAVGMFASISGLAAPFHLPAWMNEVQVHTGGADFSVFLGLAAGGLVYAVLGAPLVRRQRVLQDQLIGL
jgi:purine-cytosine permease-like protein